VGQAHWQWRAQRVTEWRCRAEPQVGTQGGHAPRAVSVAYGGRLSSAEPLSRPQTACRVLPAGQRSATQRVEACQPAAAGHGSDAGAPRWHVRRRAGARASRSGRAGRPESPARCRAGACRPPWPALWRQAALAAGGPSAENFSCAATSTGAENGFLRVCYMPSYAATAARHRRYAADR
jgi:hypothetical protein